MGFLLNKKNMRIAHVVRCPPVLVGAKTALIRYSLPNTFGRIRYKEERRIGRMGEDGKYRWGVTQRGKLSSASKIRGVEVVGWQCRQELRKNN